MTFFGILFDYNGDHNLQKTNNKKDNKKKQTWNYWLTINSFSSLFPEVIDQIKFQYNSI